MNYYNEIDPFAAAWLRELIKADHLPQGDVDERDIRDVLPGDLGNYAQCHFFAGVGGWSRALRLAGWPDDRPVWTGSCPCQPFSASGKQLRFADERHLWPAWFHLIEQSKPKIVLGEQVEKAIKCGWLDLVQDDMEAAGYALGAVPFPSCSVGAPFIRQRIFFVADSDSARLSPWVCERRVDGEAEVASAWREFERAHAAQRWREWNAESSIRVFADGIPNRVGRLRGYGNAIVPQAAQAFIESYMEVA